MSHGERATRRSSIAFLLLAALLALLLGPCQHQANAARLTAHDVAPGSRQLLTCSNTATTFCGTKASGYYANPCDSTCQTFFQCNNGQGWMQTCSAGTVFNPANSVCDWSYNYACPGDQTSTPTPTLTPTPTPTPGTPTPTPTPTTNPTTTDICSPLATSLVNTCLGTMTSCLGGQCFNGGAWKFLDDPMGLFNGASALSQLVFQGSPLFTSYKVSSMVGSATAQAACPYFITTGSAIGAISSACANIAPSLNAQTSYFYGKVDASNIQICAAINPCTQTYAFGFTGVTSSFEVSADPPITITVGLTSVIYSVTPVLFVPMSNIWDYGPSYTGMGTFGDVNNFQSNVIVTGSFQGDFGIPQYGTISVPGTVAFGLNLDPLGDGYGNGDFAFALSTTAGNPTIKLNNGNIVIGPIPVETQLDMIFTYHNSGDFKMQISLSTTMQLDAFLAVAPAIKEVIDALISGSGTVVADMYVDHNYVGVYLSLTGAITFFPDILGGIPLPTQTIGVLATVELGSSAAVALGFFVDGHLMCASGVGRGVGVIPSSCPSGTYPYGVECFKNCASGYYPSPDGLTCWQDCPAGMTTGAGSCWAPVGYGKGGCCVHKPCCSNPFQSCAYDWSCGNQYCNYDCKAGYRDDGACLCEPIQTTFFQQSYGNAPGAVGKGCGPSTPVMDAGLCYVNCPAGYVGHGPVCWKQC